MASKRNITWKCPFCDKRFNRENLVIHVDDKHENEIPEGFTPLRYVFHYINKKPLDYHGRCTECKGPTPWDEEVGRYKRQCGKKECHDSFVKRFEENMVKKKGYTRETSTQEGLEKMLANRKISGQYTFQNGKKKGYVGSYEKKCLEFMDKVMNIDPDDIMAPGPTMEYKFDGKNHYYITDFYYQPYNLIIEVKDGGDNPNTRNMEEYRKKQIAKEEFIIKHTDYNYIRLTNNDFAQLMSVFADLKMQLVDNSKDRVIHVNEAAHINTNITFSNKFEYVKNITDTLTKNELSHICTGDTYKDSKYIIYRKVCLVNRDPAAFIDIFSGPDFEKDECALICACKKKYRGNGLIKLCAKDMAEVLKEKGYKTIYWETTKDNIASSHLAKSLGFTKSKDINSDDDNYMLIIESYNGINEKKVFDEFMNALTSGYFPGYEDCDAYICTADYMQNNVFANCGENFFAIASDPGLHNLIYVNNEGVLTSSSLEEFDKTYPGVIDHMNIFALKVPMSGIHNALANYIGKILDREGMYYSVFKEHLYSIDQVRFSNKVLGEITNEIYDYNTIYEMTLGTLVYNESDMLPKENGEYFNFRNGKNYIRSKINPNFFVESSSKKSKIFMEQILLGGMINNG